MVFSIALLSCAVGWSLVDARSSGWEHHRRYGALTAARRRPHRRLNADFAPEHRHIHRDYDGLEVEERHDNMELNRDEDMEEYMDDYSRVTDGYDDLYDGDYEAKKKKKKKMKKKKKKKKTFGGDGGSSDDDDGDSDGSDGGSTSGGSDDTTDAGVSDTGSGTSSGATPPTTISAPTTVAGAPKLKPFMTWNNLAWCPPGGGCQKDKPRNEELILVDLQGTPEATIRQYAQKHIVSCYISGGTRESWRPDAKAFPSSVLGKPMGDWPGETWLDITKYQQFAAIMDQRIKLAKDKGCHAIEADNVDCFQIPCTKDGKKQSVLRPYQIAYNKFLANTAHKYGLLIGLKNTLLLIADLVNDFDFAINESCQVYNECYYYKPFLDAGKPVFSVEYTKDVSTICSKAKSMKINQLAPASGGYWYQCVK